MFLSLSGPRAALGALGLCAALSLAACEAPPPEPQQPEETIGGVPVSQIVPGYGIIEDDGYTLPPVPPGYLQGVNKRATVPYRGTAAPGTIEIDPYAKFLYWVEPGGMAVRYPIAVGREGLGISGSFSIGRKAEWPGWTPTANMLRREPEVYGPYRGGVPGGLSSPLGARALYLYRGSRDSYYRIHGTNDWSSIGNSGSAGCIRLFNHDAIDLFDRVPSGTRVVIRTREQSERIEGPLMVTGASSSRPSTRAKGSVRPCRRRWCPSSSTATRRRRSEWTTSPTRPTSTTSGGRSQAPWTWSARASSRRRADGPPERWGQGPERGICPDPLVRWRRRSP
ncbi:ErfK/YbiS/YcfS/YnhG [Rubellimicrobium mesophilum DSM 19309]|uniref:ErfK/YbiS/YcfS/YnhG n=1 Tax=Rubellimicrobium mesophilum DSM 19309 TaxID=442562 RepID=A0A017HT38_9RHOB|nr:L,D-transpeptidase [Rubellimicrobium mesophilum]EYD77333.1 ErfK/YbiS/YcfS/YnhG [Rubellimicrobium mesophilum DSM 19309]